MLNITIKQKQEIKKWQNKYMVAKAEYETIKNISAKNELKVMQENVFTNKEGERVFAYSYRIIDQQFEKFMQLHFDENRRSGLPVYEVGIVAEADARERMMLAQTELFRLQLETIPSGLRDNVKMAQDHWKNKDKALDLILRLSV